MGLAVVREGLCFCSFVMLALTKMNCWFLKVPLASVLEMKVRTGSLWSMMRALVSLLLVPDELLTVTL